MGEYTGATAIADQRVVAFAADNKISTAFGKNDIAAAIADQFVDLTIADQNITASAAVEVLYRDQRVGTDIGANSRAADDSRDRCSASE